MFSNESFQLDFHSELLENLVPKDHTYRKLLKLVDFESLAKGIKSIYSSNSGKKAYPVESALKMLVLQQAENHCICTSTRASLLNSLKFGHNWLYFRNIYFLSCVFNFPCNVFK